MTRTRGRRPIRTLGVRLTLGTGLAVALFALTGGNSGHLAAGASPAAGAAMSRAGISGHQMRLVDDTDPQATSCGDDGSGGDNGGGDNSGGDNGGGDNGGGGGDGAMPEVVITGDPYAGGSNPDDEPNAVMSDAVEGHGYDGTAEPQYAYETHVTKGEASYDGQYLLSIGDTTGFRVVKDANGDGWYTLLLNQY